MSSAYLHSPDMAQPSGSDVSKVENDIFQTISLADTVVTLVREPISLLYNNINKTKKLKQSLGAWRAEALDENGQSRIPVLRLLEFEDHLVSTDGKIEYSTKTEEKRVSLGVKIRSFWASDQQLPSPSRSPELPNAGAACWNYFLCALGIHPGMNIANWRPSMDGYINTQNGGVEMEIDGSVLCHVINLYSTRPDPRTWTREYDEQLPNRRKTKICTFPFGELAWHTVNGQTHAHFKPGLEKELVNTKIPFGEAGSRLEPGTLFASYLTALTHGVSDSSFQLAKPSAPILNRMNRFVECFRAFGEVREEPLIISRDWFEDAARIKRRILAEGGSNRSFYDDIIKAINIEKGLADFQRDHLEEETRDRFFFDEDSFQFYLGGHDSPSIPVGYEYVDGLLRQVLESYKDQPSGSWKRTLYEAKDDVIKVLYVPRNVYISGWLLLQEFTRSCELWKTKVLLGAPVLA